MVKTRKRKRNKWSIIIWSRSTRINRRLGDVDEVWEWNKWRSVASGWMNCNHRVSTASDYSIFPPGDHQYIHVHWLQLEFRPTHSAVAAFCVSDMEGRRVRRTIHRQSTTKTTATATTTQRPIVCVLVTALLFQRTGETRFHIVCLSPKGWENLNQKWSWPWWWWWWCW